MFHVVRFASGVRYFLRMGKITNFSNPCKSLPGMRVVDEVWLCVRATQEEVHFILPNGNQIIYEINEEHGFGAQEYTGQVVDDTNVTWDYIGLSVIARDSYPRFLYPESTKQEYDAVCYNSHFSSSDVRILHTFTPVIKQEWNLNPAEERELKLFANSRGGTLY